MLFLQTRLVPWGIYSVYYKAKFGYVFNTLGILKQLFLKFKLFKANLFKYTIQEKQ